jgi:hypothetical protein
MGVMMKEWRRQWIQMAKDAHHPYPNSPTLPNLMQLLLRRLTNRLVNSLVNQLINPLVNRLINQLVTRLVRRLVNWLDLNLQNLRKLLNLQNLRVPPVPHPHPHATNNLIPTLQSQRLYQRLTATAVLYVMCTGELISIMNSKPLSNPRIPKKNMHLLSLLSTSSPKNKKNSRNKMPSNETRNVKHPTSNTLARPESMRMSPTPTPTPGFD